MKNYLIYGLAFLGLAFAKAQTLTTSESDSKKWTLQECIEYALDNNINIAQSLINVESSEIDKLDAIGAFIPTLTASGSISTNTGSNIDAFQNFINTTFVSANGGLSSQLTIFDGLANFKRLQRAKLNKYLSEYQLEQSENTTVLAVAQNYLQILLNKETLRTLEEQNRITQLSIDNTQELVDAGSVPRGDLLQIQATFADEQRQIVAAANAVEIAKINLAQILNFSDFDSFDIVTPNLDLPNNSILDNSVEEIAQNAIETQPSVKVADQNIEIAQKDLEIERARRFPRLTGFFNYSTRYQDNDRFDRDFVEQIYLNDGYNFGLQINIPIVNNLNISNSIQRRKLSIENSKLDKENAIQTLENNVYQSYNNATAALATYEAALRTVEAQELAFQYAQDRYDVGMMNSFDYNQAQNQLLNSRINASRAKYDYILGIKVLEIYYGIDPSELKL